MFFGLNEDGWSHAARPWQPAQLNPTAFRFNAFWNVSPGTISDICNQMNLAGSGRLGIVGLYGPDNAPPPSSLDYYNAVRDILAATPSNLMVQVWNEPNNPRFGNVSPSQCRTLIANAAKAPGANGRVIGPAMAPNFPRWPAYMAEAYRDRYVPSAIHIYPTSNPWTSDFDFGIKQAIGNNISANHPIYITEMGLRYRKADGTNLYLDTWDDFTRDAYLRATQQSQVSVAIFHRLLYAQVDFDINGRTYFLDQNGAPTALTNMLDPYR